jgi:hypothetical protein
MATDLFYPPPLNAGPGDGSVVQAITKLRPCFDDCAAAEASPELTHVIADGTAIAVRAEDLVLKLFRRDEAVAVRSEVFEHAELGSTQSRRGLMEPTLTIRPFPAPKQSIEPCERFIGPGTRQHLDRTRIKGSCRARSRVDRADDAVASFDHVRNSLRPVVFATCRIPDECGFHARAWKSVE